MRSKYEGKGPSYRDKPINTLLWCTCMCMPNILGSLVAVVILLFMFGHFFHIATENNRRFQLQGQCVDTGILAILFALPLFKSVCDLYVFQNPGHMVKCN